MRRWSSFFYEIARKAGKTASFFNDLETLASGNPKRIVKRMARKAVWKTHNKSAKKISDKIK